MNSRLAASLVLGIAVALGATGCAMVSPQATTIPYSPSDGVNVPDSGPLKVRNALIVTDESGTTGNLIAAIVNDTDSAETLSLGIDGETQTVRVPARSVVSLGGDDEDPLLLEGLNTSAGETLAVTFQSGTGTGVEAEVPVLDGELAYLEDFVPES
ncbi:DNA modification methylase [Microbacterium saccharophilum]|uniref:DNA modification methylase n=1 Tax=Microbacterium saccharophilum TaxID=1213358 RepID=A0A5C8HRM1_9MICO|nr:DNA modification methylase [Microbacterium saccharophilum]GEP48729.1 hypothetical protein MSA03_22370 [Microbacterium saccharophilum]SFI20678.1 hypothetical protein SAMN04487751_0363 [Microbacterium saccharophilum]